MAKPAYKKIPVEIPPVIVQPKNTFYQKAEVWLGDKQKWILSLIIFICVIFRITYFIQLNNGPCIWQHRYDESDMHFYDAWAKIIAHGNWLSDTSFHQYNAPQQWIAEYYFKTYPDEALKLQKQLGSDKSPEAMGKLLWRRWDGGKIFHQDPLYIYLVAIIYKIFGEDVRYVFVLQMIIGIFSVLLIYMITRKYFGNIAALFAGFIAAFCGPLMFYELVLVRESIIVCAGLFLVYRMEKTFEQLSKKNFFILGIIVALCILLKSTFFLFLVLIVVTAFFILRKNLPLYFQYTSYLLCGVLIMFLPLIARNAMVGVPLLSQNAIGPVAVISSNDVSYNPEESYSFNLKNTVKILEHTQGKTFPSLIDAIKTHPNAWSYFKLLIKKFALVFHWYEFPNNKNFYYYRLHAPVLWFSFVSLLIIAPLAIAGIVISVIKKKKVWPLYLLIGMHLFIVVAFLVLSRYRIPLEAAMIPFAGFAIAETIKNFQVNMKHALLTIAGIAVMAIWVGRPLPEKITLIRGMDYQQPYHFYYKAIINDYINKGDMRGALKTMSDFMSFEPDDVKKINSSSGNLNNYQVILAKVYGEFHAAYANLYQRTGNESQAQAEKNRSDELMKVVAMNDQSGSIESVLLKASSASAGQKEKLYRDMISPMWDNIKVNPNKTEPYHALNDAYLALNIPDSSILVLNELLKLNDNDFYALFQMGTIYGRYKNDFKNAVLYLEKAKAVNPKNEDVYLNLGIVYSFTQQNDKALEMMQQAATINPGNKNNLNNLKFLLKKMGRNEEADKIVVDGK